MLAGQVDPNDTQTVACLAVLLATSCRYPAKQSWLQAQELLHRAEEAAGGSLSLVQLMANIEECCFRWALFLGPSHPETIANYAVFLQFVTHDLDKVLVTRVTSVATTS